MELLALIEGLRAIRRPSSVDVYSDSQYVVKGLTEWMDGWKRKGWRLGAAKSGGQAVKNVELWQALDGLRQIHHLRMHWVRGHNDHPENERCDELAVAAIREFR